MCIATNYDVKFRGSKGWKLLSKDEDGTYWTGMIVGARKIPITKDKMADAGSGEIRDSVGNLFPAGFHIFTKKKDAFRVGRHYPDLYLCHVEFEGQQVYGEVNWWRWGYKTTTVVAKYCKLLEVCDV